MKQNDVAAENKEDPNQITDLIIPTSRKNAHYKALNIFCFYYSWNINIESLEYLFNL